MTEELRRFSKEFDAYGIRRHVQRWKRVLIMRETLRKNDLNFVKDVPMIYVTLIVVIRVSEEK